MDGNKTWLQHLATLRWITPLICLFFRLREDRICHAGNFVKVSEKQKFRQDGARTKTHPASVLARSANMFHVLR